MMSRLAAAWVIGRRDFSATVFSKTFFFFLIGPLVILSISVLFGAIGGNMAEDDMRANVAVIASDAEFAAIDGAADRLRPAFEQNQLPNLIHVLPNGPEDAQVRGLLRAGEQRILAVLTGGIEQPRLVGAIAENGSIRRQVDVILDEARQQRLRPTTPARKAELVQVNESAGSVATLRSITARMGQLLLFMLTVLLAGMLLSNLIEEKSNKVIEVLAAAVPVDAIFLGKLFAMLAVSLTGIAVWTSAALAGIALSPGEGLNLSEPAVGWPVFVLFVLVYFSANYLLLGALFLGIGSQASTVREVQTLSMPITVGQVLIFLLASFAVGRFNSPLGLFAATFPFSSPLAMIARAAQTPELWPHLLAILWQALWVWLTVGFTARMFRRNVLKSGRRRSWFRSRRAEA